MAVVYLESLADSSLLGSQVVEPVNKFLREKSEPLTADTVRLLITVSMIVEYADLPAAVDGLLAGQALLIMPP